MIRQGKSVDVTLKEEKEKGVIETTEEESPIVEVQEEVRRRVLPKNHRKNKILKEEELEEYSVGVKRRIDKLTRKMREAERREQAAVDYAKTVKNEYETSLKSST